MDSRRAPGEPGTTAGMRGRTGRRLSVIVTAADAVAGAGALTLSAIAHQLSVSTALLGVVLVATVLVGFLVSFRQPRNALGWCLLVVPLLGLVSNMSSTYSVLDFNRHHGTLPLGDLAVLLQPLWAPCIVLFIVSLVLFPDGVVPPGRVMRAIFLFVAAVSLVWMAGAEGLAIRGIVEHRLRMDGGGNLLAQDRIPAGWGWFSLAQLVLVPAAIASLLAWAVGQVAKYRASVGVRRLQLKWLYGGATISAAGAIAAATGAGGMAGFAILALPVSIGVAVLRYKLFEIDRVVSRTLAYLLVTGLLVGVYAGSVTLATRVLPFSSPIGVAASTIVVAALFNPLRRRVQRLVDRRFNRAGYDVERLVSAFAARLRESVDATVVRNDLLSVVDTAFEPASSALWLRPREAASSSRPASG